MEAEQTIKQLSRARRMIESGRKRLRKVCDYAREERRKRKVAEAQIARLMQDREYEL